MPAYAVPRPYTRFTEADARLAEEMAILRRLKAEGHPLYNTDTIAKQPANSTPFVKTGSVAVSLPLLPNTRYTLFEFNIPNGCYGVLKNRAHWVEGAGFVEGSGALTWSLAIGDGWLFDEGNMIYTIGPDNGGEITSAGGGFIIRPNVKITYYVTTGAVITLDAAAVILARLRGWYVAA